MSSSEFEKRENEKYKTFIGAQLDEGSFCNFRREKQFDYLFPRLRADVDAGATSLLDLCCGYGRLTHFLKAEFPRLQIHGVDYLPPLVAQAEKNLAEPGRVSFEVGNAMEISSRYPKKFDVTVIYKTVSWLPYYETIVAEAIKTTRRKVYITSLFWDGDLDFITKLYKNPLTAETENYTYLNTYSLPKFREYCLRQGAREVKAEPMYLDVDLPRPADPSQIATYTEKTADGRRLEITGNIVLHWKLIELTV